MATPASKPETETSVMFSLRELRAIEDARRADERMARERAIAEAAARAAADAEARRAAELAAIRAREDAARAAREEAEQRAREDALRLREAEARARAAADAALAQQRLYEEVALRREQIARTRPKALFALCGVSALIALALGALYVARAGDAERLDDSLAQARATHAAQEQRIAALQAAQHGDELVIAGLRAQFRAISEAFRAHPPAFAVPAPAPAAHGHAHGLHVSAATPPTVRPPLELGDCANQPLLCTK
jgi:hypothetical protein